ncbi:MAG: hypothetical protein M3355_12010 [Actinomycetota bacterium]|nr:hypothetical protein [Actinomycetota bacterium]
MTTVEQLRDSAAQAGERITEALNHAVLSNRAEEAERYSAALVQTCQAIECLTEE